MRRRNSSTGTWDPSQRPPPVATDPPAPSPDEVARQVHTELLARGLAPRDIRRVGLALICLTGSVPQTR